MHLFVVRPVNETQTDHDPPAHPTETSHATSPLQLSGVSKVLAGGQERGLLEGDLRAIMKMMGPSDLSELEDEVKVIQQNVRAWILRCNYKSLRKAAKTLQVGVGVGALLVERRWGGRGDRVAGGGAGVVFFGRGTGFVAPVFWTGWRWLLSLLLSLSLWVALWMYGGIKLTFSSVFESGLRLCQRAWLSLVCPACLFCSSCCPVVGVVSRAPPHGLVLGAH